MSSLFVAYAAGLFDGEGCIAIRKMKQKNSRYCFSLTCVVNMTDPRPVRALMEHFGYGTVSQGQAHPIYRRPIRWTIVCQTAADFLRQVQPYLLVKREEAALALEFQAHIEQTKGYWRRPDADEVLKYRERCYRRLQELKRPEIHS